jgi:hypothetical protein
MHLFDRIADTVCIGSDREMPKAPPRKAALVNPILREIRPVSFSIAGLGVMTTRTMTIIVAKRTGERCILAAAQRHRF